MWQEHFSVPLTHLKQGQLTLELWEQTFGGGGDSLVGSAQLELQQIPLSRPVVDQGYAIISDAGKATAATLFVSLFVEERVDIIQLVPQTTCTGAPSLEEPDSSPLGSFLTEQAALIRASEQIVHAFHSSEILPDLAPTSPRDRCLVRDMLWDAADMFPPSSLLPPSTAAVHSPDHEDSDSDSDSDDEDEDEDLGEQSTGLNDIPHALPMICHPIADNVDVIKSTDISFSALVEEKTSFFNRADFSFLLKADDCEVVFVAPNQYVVFLWVREIRRQFVHYQHPKESRALKCALRYEEYHSHHSKKENRTSLEGRLKVLIHDKLHECMCSFDFNSLQLKYQDLEGVKFHHNVDIRELTLISVAQDYAVPTPLNLQVSVKSGTLTLDTKEKQTGPKAAIAELQLRMQHISFAHTKIVVNSHESTRVVQSRGAGGLMPYWNTSQNIYLSQQDLSSVVQGKPQYADENKAIGIHMHMLSCQKGQKKKKVLGSKFIPYADLLPTDAKASLDAGQEADSTRTSKLSETVVSLDQHWHSCTCGEW